MTIQLGTRLGPYEILAPLGAGGMGEVWKAKDTRLDRFVAVKVLPKHLAKNAEALARFEREAKAVAALNHPNITGLFDIGNMEGIAYVAMELLEGESLRTRLEQGPLTPRHATELAIQLAQGLAAAHEKGVVHRDLKPDNLWITKEGRLKILDFGLAKQLPSMGAASDSFMPTVALSQELHTERGMILGTLGYMSPEQVRGEAVDARSDIFSFGAVLFEMLTGIKTFARNSASETMAAILRDDPPELERTSKPIPRALRRIIEHCLEKAPDHRFRDIHDVAFALENLSRSSDSVVSIAAPFAPKYRRTTLLWAAIAAAGMLGVAWVAFHSGGRAEQRASANLVFRERSFQRQAIFRAAFMPDGATIIYSAAKVGNIPELFMIRPEYPEPQSLGLPGTQLLSISSRGELAVLLKARFIGHRLFTGTLARVTLGGIAPREILEDVREADWAPDGSDLAVIRPVKGVDHLEFPIGHVLYESSGYLSDLRVSPQGDRIALFEHPAKFDDRGSVIVVDRSGKRTILSSGWESEEGLSWSLAGDEIFFAASKGSNTYTLYGVDLSGHRRVALASAGRLTMQDISRKGQWLVTRDDKGWGISVLAPGASAERDLSWLGYSAGPSLSRDGRTLLFTDYGSNAAGGNYLVCLRSTDGGAVLRLGEGDGYGLSPDGNWAVALLYSPPRVRVYPTGPGTPLHLPVGNLETLHSAGWFPDGKHVLLEGHEPGKGSRCFQLDLLGGPPKPITPEGTTRGLISPDGLTVLYSNLDGAHFIQPLAGGPAQAVTSLAPEDRVNLWSDDGRWLYLTRTTELVTQIEKLDLTTGRRVIIRKVAPAEGLGVVSLGMPFSIANDATAYAYGYLTMKSKLFVVEGVR